LRRESRQLKSALGLKELAAIKQLETLNLYGTRVTNAGLKELKLALPKCEIYQ
jgi:internalin A